MSTRTNKEIRTHRFHRQRGLCYWCKQPMLLKVKIVLGVPPDPRMCTLEHIHDRWSPLRGKGGYKNVAACWKCNNERACVNNAAQNREALHEKSGRFPGKFNGDRLWRDAKNSTVKSNSG